MENLKPKKKPEVKGKAAKKCRYHSEGKGKQKHITGAIYVGPRGERTESRLPYRVGYSKAREGASPKFESIYGREALRVAAWPRPEENEK